MQSMGSQRVGLNWVTKHTQLPCNAALVSAVTHIYTYTPSSGVPHPHPIPPSRSSQSTELSPLCYIAASCCLSVLHMIVYSESRSVLSDCLWPNGQYSPSNSLGQNTGVGSHSLLQDIFLTQGSNQGFLHCRQTLNQLSYKEIMYTCHFKFFFPKMKASWRKFLKPSACTHL